LSLNHVRRASLQQGQANCDTGTPGHGECGQIRGKQPKLTPRQQTELTRMHATGEYTIADLMEVFSVGRATVYRTLQRATAVR
jgi:hypothetical protein